MLPRNVAPGSWAVSTPVPLSALDVSLPWEAIWHLTMDDGMHTWDSEKPTEVRAIVREATMDLRSQLSTTLLEASCRLKLSMI
jgi:hypothetical protein